MKPLVSLAIVALAALASVATLPPLPPPEWKEETDFELRVGQGYEEVDLYEVGEPLVLERGFQGGQHINVSLLARDVDPEQDVGVTAWLVRPEDGTLLEGPDRFDAAFDYEPTDPAAIPEGKVWLAGGRLFVDAPDAFLGEAVELRVEVDARDGRIGRAWFRGVAEMGPDPWEIPEEELPAEDAGPSLDAGVPDGG